MNSPVTHAECEKYRECMTNDFRTSMTTERADFNAAFGRVEAWILRLESQISKTNDSVTRTNETISDTNKTLSNITKEVAIGLFLAFIYIFGGKTQ